MEFARAAGGSIIILGQLSLTKSGGDGGFVRKFFF
jgi:hypothetical protein